MITTGDVGKEKRLLMCFSKIYTFNIHGSVLGFAGSDYFDELSLYASLNDRYGVEQPSSLSLTRL